MRVGGVGSYMFLSPRCLPVDTVAPLRTQQADEGSGFRLWAAAGTTLAYVDVMRHNDCVDIKRVEA